jgi:hypothetical protein
MFEKSGSTKRSGGSFLFTLINSYCGNLMEIAPFSAVG